MWTREAVAMGIAFFGLFVIALGAYIALIRTAEKRLRTELNAELAAVEMDWRKSFEQVLAENVALRAALQVHGRAIVAIGGTLDDEQESTGKWSMDDEDEESDE